MGNFFLIRFLLLLITSFTGYISSKINFDLKNIDNKKNVVRVAVIGGGVAGGTAGLYAARAKLNPFIYLGNLPGGQLTTTSYVENWPGIKKKLGYEIMKELQEQAEEFGACVKYEAIEKVEFDKWPFVLHTNTGMEINALSVIIATGASPKKLNIEGENLYWGIGVSSCAVCDAPLYNKNHKVYIVGAGDVSIEDAMNLSPYAGQVNILVRSNRMRAAASMQEKLKDYSNVRVYYNKQVTKIMGDKTKLTKLEILDNISNTKEEVSADGLFLAIGQSPNNYLFRNSLNLTKTGYIEIEHPTQKTSVPGVFAAGDVEDPEYRQAVVAAGSGCRAALDAIAFLRNIGISENKLQNSCSFLK